MKIEMKPKARAVEHEDAAVEESDNVATHPSVLGPKRAEESRNLVSNRARISTFAERCCEATAIVDDFGELTKETASR